ncbi:PrsW family intramembrane metalloprotease [Candidatus Peregrinibacteria bacterium]|jgi:protease PrsW|nr:PrsW family intramembrane metalloprotease [Candidatus Peregrinibacteria bacterium]
MGQTIYLVLLFLLSVLPALFLLWFFEKQDKGEKEPRKLKNKVFFAGLLMVIIAGVIESFVDGFIGDLGLNWYAYIFVLAFLITATIEEGLKLYVVKRIAYKHKKFNEVMDGITYVIIASLGFAVLENILYVMQDGFGTGIARALLAVPAHAMFSGIMGYYVGKAKFSDSKAPWDSRKLLWTGYFLAVLYHGLYNFFLLSGTYLMFAVVPLLIFMAAHLKHLINKARFEDKSQKNKPRPFTVKRGLRLILASVLPVIAILWVGGSIMLYNEGQIDGTYILTASPFPILMLIGSYLLIRRKKVKK